MEEICSKCNYFHGGQLVCPICQTKEQEEESLREKMKNAEYRKRREERMKAIKTADENMKIIELLKRNNIKLFDFCENTCKYKNGKCDSLPAKYQNFEFCGRRITEWIGGKQ